MNISSNFKRLAGASILSLAAAFGSGCASYGTTYSEGPDYNGQRTRIDNQQMDCTVITQRSGTYRGGSTTQVGDGTFTERCVSSPYTDHRRYGTSPAGIMENLGERVGRNTAREVERRINDVLRNALD